MSTLKYPTRGNALSRGIARTLMRLFGWKVANEMFEVRQCVIVGGPHTSNWDGFFTMLAMFAVGLDARIMMKSSVFKWPIAGILRWIGFIPINRAEAQQVVAQTVAHFEANPYFAVIISPEGTRDSAKAWKTGFYRIAHAANVPIVAATADYKKKEIAFAKLLQPSGDINADLEILYDVYRPVTAKYPNKRSLPLREKA